jgi:hypothetical protein
MRCPVAVRQMMIPVKHIDTEGNNLFGLCKVCR